MTRLDYLNVQVRGRGWVQASLGGGASGGGADGGVSLTIWADDKYSRAIKDSAARWGRDNDVQVNVQAVSKDLQTVFVTASQAGKGPDLVMGAHDWIGNLVQNGAIDPLQLTDDTRAAFDPLAIKGVTYNGQIYGIPYAIENVVLFRNTDLVPEAPGTLEELVAKGRELKAAGKVSEIMALPSGPTATPTTCTRSTPRPAATCSARPPAATTTPRTWAWPGRRRPGHSRRSPSWARKARGRSSARSPPRTSPACSPAARPPSCCPAPGRSPTSRRAASPTPSPPSPGSGTASRTDPDMARILAAGKDGDIMPAIPAMATVWDPLGKAQAATVGGAPPDSTVAAAAKAIQGQLK